MAMELLPDIVPIDAGPIIIDEHRYGANDYYDTHIDLADLETEAMENGISPHKAELAMLFSVRALIRHFQLGILSPYEAKMFKNGEIWGPHDPYDYRIDQRAFFESRNLILRHAKNSTDDEDVIHVVKLGGKVAEDKLRSETGHLSVEELPGAIHTDITPRKHLEAGHLIAYSEFADSASTLGTSPAKAAAVFDRIVLELGDKLARRSLAQLEVNANTFDRRNIRAHLYIKTQGLADLAKKLSSIPVKERANFNNLSMQLIYLVLNDELPDDFTE